MRRSYKEVLLLVFCLLIGCALPALTALIFGYIPTENRSITDDSPIILYSHGEEGEGRTLTMRELLVGTLAAYNPSDTPIESLKAQAVALRSRACCLIGYCKEEQSSLCDSTSHGLAYADREELTALWGKDEAALRVELAAQAVDAVKNEVLCYDECYVLALTHSSSPGETKEMEGYPYLASVSTPEEGSENRIVLSRGRFAEIAAESLGIACLEGEDWAIELTAGEAGRVEKVQIGDREVDGGDFAAAMGLPSDAFTVTVGEEITFVCRGVGSGYGLSREGAALYGSQGLDYQEILMHYFPGSRLSVI